MANELILIVEDNEKNLKLVRDVLQFRGYLTLEATTGEDGVRQAKARTPDLILMDIQLPGMDGITALGELRADPATRAIPVIAVTASAMTHDRKKIMAAGFDGYQSKPIKVKDFMDAVREMLDQRAAKEAHAPEKPPRRRPGGQRGATLPPPCPERLRGGPPRRA